MKALHNILSSSISTFKNFSLLPNITLRNLTSVLHIYVVQTLYPASTINGGVRFHVHTNYSKCQEVLN
jgi:hypothetical protein